MFQTLVNTILIMSVVGTIIYMVAYLLRSITMNFFDSTWHLYMTCITLLVFLLPISLVLNALKIDLLGFFTYSEKIIIQMGEGNYLENGMASLDVLLTSSNQSAAYLFYKALLENFVIWIKYIWISGVLVFSVLNLKHYIAFKKVVSSSYLIEDNLVQEVLNACKREIGVSRNIEISENKTLGTPILMGLFKSQIILPEGTLQASELELIFSHECIHLKRGHLWVKTLLICVSVIHWFNPLCLLLRKDVNRLCELACDEELVEKINYNERKKYAETIISMLDKRVGASGIVCSALSESSKNLKERLSKIFEYKKPKKGMRLLSLGVALSIVLLSVPVSGAVAHRVTNTFERNTLQTPVQDTIMEMHPVQVKGGDEVDEDSILASLPEANSDITLSWPIPSSKYVTAPFGKRYHPVSKEEFMHSGVDIAAQKGTEIVAAGSGEVIYSEWNDNFGYTIRIKHDDVYSTAYAHCSKLLVKSGDIVKSGQKIAEVGSTGKSTGPHLHFEVTKEGEIQDPLTYVNVPN